MRTTNLIALFGALTLVACGGKGGSPMGPSDPAAPITLVGNVRGTVVEGTSATTASATTAVGDALANLRVSVEGTSLSAMTDASGAFVIANVPAGSVALRFETVGINARLGGLSVSNGQTLVVRVGVSGSTAVLLDLNPTPIPTPSPSPTPRETSLGVSQEFWSEVLALSGGKTKFTSCFIPAVNLVAPPGYEREVEFAKGLWAGVLTFGSGPTIEVVPDPTVEAERANLSCGEGGKLLLNPISLRNGSRLFAHGIGHGWWYDVPGPGLMGLGMELSPGERWFATELLRIYNEGGFGVVVTIYPVQ